jgi:hypothetical protein
MRCEVCMQLLDDFIDGELSGIEHHKVEQHIRECSECSREAEFLRRLSRDASSLPKDIQPDKNLWPGIKAGIIAAPSSRNKQDTSGGSELERNRERHKITAWVWRIPVAAMLVLLLMAGAYLALRRLPGENSKGKTIYNVPDKPSVATRSPSSGPLDNLPDAIAQDEVQIPASPHSGAFGNHSPSRPTIYPLDLSAKAFVSNYGIFAVRQDRDPISPASGHNLILCFDRDGRQEWIPPLPLGSTLLSVYPGSGNRLWASYEVEEPEFQTTIAELNFGIDSQVRNVWTSFNLHICKFVISQQGLIYATGFQNGFSKAVAELKKDQSITARIMYIIDPKTGEEKNLFPITLTPQFNSQLWAAQTVQEVTNLANNTVISAKSNGNFFITIDQINVPTSVRGLIKNEAVEYSSDGTVAATWDLGSLKPDAYLNKIFVDIDDSILAEIIRFADMGAPDSLSEAVTERYLLRIDSGGRLTRYDPGLYSNEAILGWIGQREELVSAGDTGTRQQIGIRNLPF